MALVKTMRNSGSSASSRMPIGAMLSACHHEICEAGPGGGASAPGALEAVEAMEAVQVLGVSGASGRSGSGAPWPSVPRPLAVTSATYARSESSEAPFCT